jgi:hypothetical protein
MQKVIQLTVVVAIVFSAIYMWTDSAKLNPECAIASNSDDVPKCDIDPDGHGED